jgi:acetyl esterase/lipase
VCFSPWLLGQEPTRFRDIIYDGITIDKNVSYSENIAVGMPKKFYAADIYEAIGDHSQKRPLIIWLHGGAFKFGSKNAAGTSLWCGTFSQRGYVCVAINYRLNKRNPLFKKKTFYKGCYEALEHVSKAVRFFKQNALKYRIDTNTIILAGNSAGGMIALQYVYSNCSELKKLINPAQTNFDAPDDSSSTIKAVINFWGAIFNEEWLRNARTPIVSVHGKKDKLVPIADTKKSMYGSYIIHKQADLLGIPNRIKVYDDYAHELHRRFIPVGASKATKHRWLEAGQFAADFLYDELFRKKVSPSIVHKVPYGIKTESRQIRILSKHISHKLFL